MNGSVGSEGIECPCTAGQGMPRVPLPMVCLAFVFGVMMDKDWKEILNLLSPLASDIILTRPAIERAAPPELLALSVPGATVAGDVKNALSMARKRAVEGDIIVVTGSLYTVGEAKTAIYEAA